MALRSLSLSRDGVIKLFGLALALPMAVAAQPVTISSVTPNSGLTNGGTPVVISGTGFIANVTVYFGNAAATSVTVTSSTNITATTPPYANTGSVNVTVVDGNFQPAVLTNGFTYFRPSITVSSISPAAGPIGGGTLVSIAGTNFTNGVVVSFGNNLATSVAVTSATNITAVTPAAADYGPVNVTVSLGGAYQAGVLTNGFTYVNPSVISILDPNLLNAAIQGGGTVTFAVDGTITLTNTIVVSNNVVLDGAGHSVTISGGSNVEIFILPPKINFVLRNLTLANGLTNGGVRFVNGEYGEPSYGGAIYAAGNLTVDQCIFSNNVAHSVENYTEGPASQPLSGLGGAIYNTGTLTISNSVFANNSAIGGNFYGTSQDAVGGGGFGGAICNIGGNVYLANVAFSSNSVAGGYGTGAVFDFCGDGDGGAVYSSGGTLIASNVIVVSNTAQGGQGPSSSLGGFAGYGGGGAFYLTGTTATILNSTFSNNITTGGAGESSEEGQGGCVYSTGNAVVMRCTITACQANGANGSFTGNGSSGLGGAVYNAGVMQLSNVFLTDDAANGGGAEPDNSAAAGQGLGGAVYNAGSIQITASVLSSNTALGASSSSAFNPPNVADGFGGGIYNSSVAQIFSCTLAANVANGSSSYYAGGTAPHGSGWGGGIANAGYLQLSNCTLSSNMTWTGIGTTNTNGASIYNTGSITADESSTLIPYVVGAPPFSYQWQINGTSIPGDTNAIFGLGSVLFTSAESYDLETTDTNGNVASVAQILNLPTVPMEITSVTPNSGSLSGGTVVNITGIGFSNTAMVYFGDVGAYNVTVNSSTSITCNAWTPTVYGPVTVTVTNVGYGQFAVLPDGFTYQSPPQNFTAGWIPGQGVQLSLTGAPNTLYSLLATTNFSPPAQWQTVASQNADTNGNWTFIDTNALTTPARYYWAISQ